MSKQEKIYLFVYGTLRRQHGLPLMNNLMPHCCFIGQGWARGTLYDFGDYPGATAGGGIIRGDIFEISDTAAVFTTLDAYEGAEYRRERTEVFTDNGRTVKGFIYWYTGSIEGALRIHEEDYFEYLKTKKDRLV